jgi:hypothetical protein
MDDLETDAVWLERLGSLNAVIAASGHPLVGNLFYDHLQGDFLESAPNLIVKPKRDRFRSAVEGRARLLEIGVNGGHSAYLALTSNPDLEFHGVDICEHSYVLPVVEWLKREFPGRVFFYPGSCLKVLPLLASQPLRFDCFHIDGAKYTYFSDILNCDRLAADGRALAIIDDMEMKQVARIWSWCLRLGVLTSAKGFPTMSDASKYQNGIGILEPVAPWRLAFLRGCAGIDRFVRLSWVHMDLDADVVRRPLLSRLTNKVVRRMWRIAHGNWQRLGVDGR